MRRTTIRLAIVALLLGGPAWAQEVVPGQSMGQAQPTTGVATPGGVVSEGPYEVLQTPVQPSPTPGGLVAQPRQAPPQQWQPMETLVPMPDVTTSNVAVPDGQMPMMGPMVQPPGHGPCDEKSGKGYCCPPNWYLDQRVRVMHHPKPRGTLITHWMRVEENIFNGTFFDDYLFRTDAMSTRSVPFEPAAGYEITIGRYLGRDSDNRDQFLEFTYYGMMNWEQEFGVHQTDRPTATSAEDDPNRKYPGAENLAAGQSETFGNLDSVFDDRLTGFNRADDMWERYASRFDNFELNFRIRPRLRHDRMVLYQNGRWQREAQDDLVTFSFLGGLRGMSLDESYDIVGTGLIVVNEPATTQATRGEFNCRTHNDMVGLQIGGDAVYHKGYAELGIRMKGGVFINFADQSSSLLSTGGLYDPMGDPELYDASGPYTDVNNQFSGYRTARSRDVAGVAELGFTAAYQIRTNLVARAAYDLMWLSGVALAPEQISGQIGTHGYCNRNGLQFMQSLSLGLELDW